MIRITVTPHESFVSVIGDLLGSIYSKDNSAVVNYISFNKTYSFIKDIFFDFLGDGGKFFVIDATTTVLNPYRYQEKIDGNCIFLKPTGPIEELKSVHNELMDSIDFKHIIFDSISNLFVYKLKEEFIWYMDWLINRCRNDSINLYLFCVADYFKPIYDELIGRGVKITSNREGEFFIN